MLKRIFLTLTLLCLLTDTLRAADDPFVGRWKLNFAKSSLDGDQLKIEDLGGNRYKLTSHNASSTIVADGTDQPDQFGTTTSITLEGLHTWRMVVKDNRKVTQSMTYTLSPDSGNIEIKGSNTRPDGSTLDWASELKRDTGRSGWSGTWVEVKGKGTFSHELDIEAYSDRGLTFKSPDHRGVLSMRFDGKSYKAIDPDKPSDRTLFSGKRVDEHSLELTCKMKSHLVEHFTYRISPDGKTLTVAKATTTNESGQQHEQVSVYDKL